MLALAAFSKVIRGFQEIRDSGFFTLPKTPPKIQASIENGLIDRIGEVEETLFKARNGNREETLTLHTLGNKAGYGVHLCLPNRKHSFLIVSLMAGEGGTINVHDISTGQSMALARFYSENAPFWAAKLISARLIRELSGEPSVQASFYQLLGSPDDPIIGQAMKRWGKPGSLSTAPDLNR